MKLAFYVNRVEGEKPEYSTTRLALAALGRGHEVFYLDVDSMSFGDGASALHARRPARDASSLEEVTGSLQDAEPVRVEVSDLDAVMLRLEPEREADDRPWAASSAIEFGGALARAGVVVLNDPAGLARAASKLYLLEFPRQARPSTLLTRDVDEIKAFVQRHGGRAVLKPHKGARGENVFFVTPDEEANLNQMIEAIKRDGYVVAQEYVPEASEGDVRVLFLDGELLTFDGKVAVFRRIPPPDDLRANMSKGGDAEPVEPDDALRSLAALVGPKLRADGMFLAGVDVVGGKVIEVNVESPGGLGSPSFFAGVDFPAVVIEALERKL